MDLLTRAEIESLANPGAEDTQISLFMPTHRFGDGVEADRLRWKNLIAGVESILAPRMRQHVADESGIAFARTRVINDDPSVFNALAEWVHLTAGTP